MTARRSRPGTGLVLLSDDRTLAAAIDADLAHLGLPADTTVRTASVVEVWQLLAREREALFVLDDGAPGVDGPALLAALVAEGLDPGRVVYLAARHAVALEVDVRRRGVLYYTAKPPAPGVIEKLLGAARGRAGPAGLARPP
jgi:DNA-binding response OmpR family regulator